ncbi:hypothetical protein [Clostridium sp. VAP41]|nr:hypothetical protein [Clostridium sp. VAP41]
MLAGSVPSISVSAGELGSMAVGVGAFYNAVTNRNEADGAGEESIVK